MDIGIHSCSVVVAREVRRVFPQPEEKVYFKWLYVCEFAHQVNYFNFNTIRKQYVTELI